MSEKFKPTSLFKIVSGGQTGADRAGLDWAIEHSIRHGGWCPRGRKAEDGRIASRYRLTETPSDGYLERNRWNVRDSDATLVFTLDEVVDGGSRRTIEFAEKLGKPYLHVHPAVPAARVASFLKSHRVQILNVAGKRESSNPGIGQFVHDMLDAAIDASGSPAQAS